MLRHAENAAYGHDAGAADAGHDDVEGLLDRRQLRLRQRTFARNAFGVKRDRDARAALELAALDGDEGGTESLHAGKVLVAAGLVDGALAPPFGLQRLHRHAIRFYAAVAAAFADQLVDDHALVRIGEF